MAFITSPIQVQVTTRRTSSTTPATRTPVRASAGRGPSRRAMLRTAAQSLGAAALLAHIDKVAPASAFSLNDVKQFDAERTLRSAREKACDLYARIQNGTGIKDDDVDYLIRFFPIWLDPARMATDRIASLVRPKVADPAVVRGLAVQLSGHLAELRAEVRAKSKEGIMRELDEFVETVDTILKTVKSA